jgi:hypothetical protein
LMRAARRCEAVSQKIRAGSRVTARKPACARKTWQASARSHRHDCRYWGQKKLPRTRRGSLERNLASVGPSGPRSLRRSGRRPRGRDVCHNRIT